LNALTVSEFTAGKLNGTRGLSFGIVLSGFCARFGGNWSSVAKLPTLRIDRPSALFVLLAIDPRDRIAVLRINPLEGLDRSVNIAGADQLAIEIRALDVAHPEFQFENHARQPHPADSRPEQR